MQFIREQLDKLKPNFEKGGKFEKLHALWDANETFLFVPERVTSGGVHIRDGIDLKRTMIHVVIAMLPCLFFGMWNVGYQHFKALGMGSIGFMEGLTFMQNLQQLAGQHMELMLFGAMTVLPIVIVSYSVGLGVEFTFACIKNHQVNEGFLVSGMLIPLVMPVTIPLWMVGVATIFAVVIGKEVFGGTGMNILNPALTARAFIFFAYPGTITGDIWIDETLVAGEALVDGFSGATPLALSAVHQVNMIPSCMEMLIGTIPGSIGETSFIAIMIGAAILIGTGIGSWRIMISVFLGGYLMGLLLNGLAPADNPNHFMHLPASYHLILGGFAFGAVFMATDPVTATQTNTGKWIYGFLIGVFAILIRIWNPAYPEGMMLSILFFNVMAPLIDHYVVQSNIQRRLARA